jgi:hypothetical protein
MCAKEDERGDSEVKGINVPILYLPDVISRREVNQPLIPVRTGSEVG